MLQAFNVDTHDPVQHVPLQKPSDSYIIGVTSLYADGDEALAIRDKFGEWDATKLAWNMSIPWNYRSHNYAQTWHGDIAKTILAGL
ncbi:hypothetical protein [Hymenobacter glacieicola]|uniref:Uncharacterized protein n=1 Tax=Hymenobacter glacieicola TaxID=1562124 RepID=A0ABQ1X5F4_9BACT|nr:hypothetical protein [Hymenobacter glacieicola]GGG60836.1 hypothetical protein GCM10011378_41090 [Hymenobacter glacieicola]